MRGPPGAQPRLEVAVPALPAINLRDRTKTGHRSAQIRTDRNYVVDCAVYVDGYRLPGTWNHQEAIEEVRRRGPVSSGSGCASPTNNRSTASPKLSAARLAVEDAVHHQRPSSSATTTRCSWCSRRPVPGATPARPAPRSSTPGAHGLPHGTSSSPSGTGPHELGRV